MASLRQSASVASAVCKQTATPRLTSSVASVQTCSRFSSLPSCKFRVLQIFLTVVNSPESSLFFGITREGYSQPHPEIQEESIYLRSCYFGHWNKSKSNKAVLSFAASLFQSSYRPTSSQFPIPSRQSRTFLTQLRRDAQALKEQPISQSTPLPKPGKQPKPTLSLTNLPYFVRRTGSNQLPVYLVTKAGGTKQLTKIQKTEGDLDALRSDLAQTLGVDTRSPDVSINRLTGHIIVKVCFH